MTPPLLRPEWPAHSRVQAACSLREGGVSQGPFASLNLGDHVGDDVSAVAENRSRFAAALDARPVFLKQVHGLEVARIDASTPDGTQADACIATASGVACTIMVADCMPVLFADAAGAAVAAAHAGWRGLAGEGGRGVLETTWDAFRASVARPEDAMVWLGPCIGPDAFEVGPEVRAAFTAHDAAAALHFRPQGNGKYFGDLQALARARLRALGINRIYGNDGTRDWCTVSNPARFFSHRRDRTSGRFAAAIVLS